MASLQNTLKVDTFLQGTLILLVSYSAFIGHFFSGQIRALAVYGMIALGAIQVGSASINIFTRQNQEARGLYLLSALGFFLSFPAWEYLSLHLYKNLLNFALMSIAVLAIHYFTITCRDMIVENTVHLNFK